MTFTVGQRVRVVSTYYKQKHLQAGGTGTVQSLLGGLVIVEVDNDPNPGNWSYKSSELEAIAVAAPVGHDGDWDLGLTADADAVWVEIDFFEHSDEIRDDNETAFRLHLSDIEAQAFAQSILDAVEQHRLGEPNPADDRSYWTEQ